LIDELREAVEHMQGVPARYVETVEVDERFKGQIVWQKPTTTQQRRQPSREARPGPLMASPSTCR
jgi:hypothetical protein